MNSISTVIRRQTCLLREEDIGKSWIQNSRIVHVGSVTQVLPKRPRRARKALELARKYGVITSFDVNFRLGIWRGA